MPSDTYTTRRSELQTYFDDHAAEAWAKLTSDAPVSGVRATVRAGRDRMRATLLSWLPDDMAGRTLLDAGCGTGALACEAAERGAQVTAVDLAGTLLSLAEERLPADLSERIRFISGDMLAPSLGEFDHIVAMDSLIHYQSTDMVNALGGLAERCHYSLLFTFAPRTPLLALMHSAGRLFPRGDRAPGIVPVSERDLERQITQHAKLLDWSPMQTRRIKSGFYTSQAMELRRL